jgi:hypothetical protein
VWTVSAGKVDLEMAELKLAAVKWTTQPDAMNERQLAEAAVTFSEAVKRALKTSKLEQWERESPE